MTVTEIRGHRFMGQFQQFRVLASALTCLSAASLLFAGKSLHASTSSIALSYQADGSCYCTQAVSYSSVATSIVPTPIGGQTVAQVCERLGKGPGLKLTDGRYNHPAYSDIQCGNPTNKNAETANADQCIGLIAPAVSECTFPGPRWNLVSAYSEKSVKKQTVPSTASAVNKPLKKPANQANHIGQSSKTAEVTAKPVSTITVAKNSLDQPRPRVAVAGNTLTAQIIEDSSQVATKNSRPSLATVTTSKSAIATAKPTSSRRKTVSNLNQAIGKQSTAVDTQVISLESIPAGLTQDEIMLMPSAATENGQPTEAGTGTNINAGEMTAVAAKPAVTMVMVTDSEGNTWEMPESEVMELPLASMQGATTPLDPSLAAATVESSGPAKLRISAENGALQASEPTAQAASGKSVRNFPGAGGLISFKRSRLDYAYLGIASTGYDFGGGGAELEASFSNHQGVAIMVSAGVADEYNEASLGLSFYVAPFPHVNTDVVVNFGVEHGQFDLGITDLEDTGSFISGYIRTRPMSRLELTGGGRYSSYFDGDFLFVATGTFRLTSNLNAFSKMELGDNDQLSLGVRYFY